MAAMKKATAKAKAATLGKPTKKPAKAAAPAKAPATAKSATPKKGSVTPLPEAFDIVLKGGRVIDPANGIDMVMDVAIAGGRIAAVAPDIAMPPRTRKLNLKGAVVTPGLIDTHAHIYQHVSGDFGLAPDLVGVRSGVTTLVDQGGPSALTINGFRAFIAEPAKSSVCCFISNYLAGGLLGHRYVDLYGPSGINVKAVVKAAEENPDLVRGIKAHAEPGSYSRWRLEALKLAKEAGRELGLPVYIHLGTLWPEKDGRKVSAKKIIDELVPLLDPGDILAHPFTRYPSGFVDAKGKVHPLVFEALARGVRIDVGRGAHFSFDNARHVLDAGILPFTLGADLHGYNVRFPEGGRWYRGTFSDTDILEPDDIGSPFSSPHGLHHAMSELLALGVALPDIVRMCTSNAATMIGMEGKVGTLAVGAPADISVFRLIEGAWPLMDSNGVEVMASTLIHPQLCLRGGTVHQADSPLLQGMIPKAA
jgi:dihydroorotase